MQINRQGTKNRICAKGFLSFSRLSIVLLYSRHLCKLHRLLRNNNGAFFLLLSLASQSPSLFSPDLILTVVKKKKRLCESIFGTKQHPIRQHFCRTIINLYDLISLWPAVTRWWQCCPGLRWPRWRRRPCPRGCACAPPSPCGRWRSRRRGRGTACRICTVKERLSFYNG